jgi:AcrR family transcriptional regulator
VLEKPNPNSYSVFMIEAVQARSRATGERILQATERLLETRAFEDLSMAAIAESIGMSVGGVYARFASKDALLKALHARYEAYRTAFLLQAFDPDAWSGTALDERVHGICEAMVRLMRDRRHVLRSFLLRYWSRPEEAEGEFSERLGGIYQRAIDLMLDRRAAIGAPDPEHAARTAMAVIAGSCRDIIVMKPPRAPGAILIADTELADALARAALGILQFEPKERE